MAKKEPKETKDGKKYTKLKFEMANTFARLGILPKDQHWDEQKLLDLTAGDAASQVFLTREQFRQFLTEMGYMTDQKASKRPSYKQKHSLQDQL